MEGVPHKDLQFFPKLVEVRNASKLFLQERDNGNFVMFQVFERVPEHVGFCIDIKYTETYRVIDYLSYYFCNCRNLKFVF